jgi:hypothetical protein
MAHAGGRHRLDGRSNSGAPTLARGEVAPSFDLKNPPSPATKKDVKNEDWSHYVIENKGS